MSRSVNTVTLIGNLGADPEVRSIASGDRVASLSLATSRTWTDRSGAKQEKTEWHRLVLWSKLAEIAERYLKKGDSIYVTGSIEHRSYEDKDGVTKYSTEIRVRDLVMLGGGSRDGQPAQRQERQQPAAKASSYEDFSTDFPDDDDLPFS